MDERDFEFLREEVLCDGAPQGLVCRKDIWQDELGSYMIREIIGKRIWVATCGSEEIFDVNVKDWMKTAPRLLNRHGEGWQSKCDDDIAYLEIGEEYYCAQADRFVKYDGIGKNGLFYFSLPNWTSLESSPTVGLTKNEVVECIDICTD